MNLQKLILLAIALFVSVQMSAQAYAGEDQIVCQSSTILGANIPGMGMGEWSVIMGTGGFDNPNSNVPEVSGLAIGENIFRWSEMDGAIVVSYDDVSIFNYRVEAEAGFPQTICMGAPLMLNANDPSMYFVATGTWTVSAGNAFFDNFNSPSSNVTGLTLGMNMLTWTVSNGYCSGSDQVEITVLNAPVADAGQDIDLSVDCPEIAPNTAMLQAAMPQGAATGYWMVESGYGDILNPTNYNTQIVNLEMGVTTLRWYVSHGSCFSIDLVDITRQQIGTLPAVEGDLVLHSTYPEELITSAEISTDYETSGYWEQINGTSIDISDPESTATSVTNLEQGETILRWNVMADGSCIESSNLRILVGYDNVVPDEGVTDLNWSDPEQWNTGTVPTLGDFVVIEDVIVNMPEGNAEAGFLNVGSGTTFNLGGPGRAVATFTTHNLYIQQTAERGNAVVNIGSGGTLYISQTAEKGSNHGVHVLSGGSLYIQQTAERAVRANASLNMDAGGKIYISQTAERNDRGTAGRVNIGGGGSLYISQTAERDERAVAFDVLVSRGGGLYISQTAEKSTLPATLSAFGILNTDGKIVIGDGTVSAEPAATLTCKKFQIEPLSGVRGLAMDTNVVVQGNGAILAEPFGGDDVNWIRIKNGTSFSIKPGGVVALNNANRTPANFIIEDGGSFIDENETNTLTGKTEINFEAGVPRFYSASVATPSTTGLINATQTQWDEVNAVWETNPNSFMEIGRGYNTSNSVTEIPKLAGILNVGQIAVPITAEHTEDPLYTGWNCIGNPYASAIDFEAITINAHANSYLTLDPMTNAYSAYQQGGISINGGNRYIAPNQAFFVKAESNTEFVFENTARAHYFDAQNMRQETGNRSVDNFLRFSINDGAGLQSEAVIYVSDTTSNAVVLTEDVVLPGSGLDYPFAVFTTNGTDAENLIVNALQHSGTSLTSIPVYFEAGSDGTYNLSIDEFVFSNFDYVGIKDLSDDSEIQLTGAASFSFDYDITDAPNRFEFTMLEQSNTETIDTDLTTVYSDRNDIYVNTMLEGQASVKVFDISGKLVAEYQIDVPGLNRISTNLGDGVYLVKVTSAQTVHTEKVVIR